MTLPKSLVLVELLGIDRFRHYRNEMFPFICGLVREMGLPVHWTRIGVPVSPGFPDRFFADVKGGERDLLCSIIKETEATHLIFNESLSLDLSGHLRENFPGIRLFSIGDWPETIVEPLDQYSTPEWLVDFLGIENARIEIKSPLADQAIPDYRYDYANRLVEEIDPFIKIVCGLECLYLKGIADNPYYREVDLSVASRDYGCAFCEGGGITGANWRFSTQPLDLAFRQIERAAATFPRKTGHLKFMIMGAILFAILEKFIERLLKSPIPPSEFLFSVRVDELLAKREALEKSFPLLREKGHSIHIWVMGIENFSDRENERLNKGLTCEKIIECDRLVRRWEAEFPETFAFSRYGGYSFILFTPWTEISDLRINLDYARKLGIDSHGFFLRSRLQLLPERAVTLLAKKDNLLTDDSELPDFDSGCIQTWQVSELKWKFRNPEIAHIYAISSRLALGIEEMKGDELYSKIQNWVLNLPAKLRAPFDLFEVLLDVVEKNPARSSLYETIREMERLLITRHGIEAAGTRAAMQASGALFPSEEMTALGAEIMKRLTERLEKEKDNLYMVREVKNLFSIEDGREQIEVHFEGGGRVFSLHVEGAMKERRYYLITRKYGVCYHKDTPPNTDGEKALLAITAGILKEIESGR